MLETLVDLLCIGRSGSITAKIPILPLKKHPSVKSNGGSDNFFFPLEHLYLAYDCDIQSADVVAGLVAELCRCCDGDELKKAFFNCLTFDCIFFPINSYTYGRVNNNSNRKPQICQ